MWRVKGYSDGSTPCTWLSSSTPGFPPKSFPSADFLQSILSDHLPAVNSSPHPGIALQSPCSSSLPLFCSGRLFCMVFRTSSSESMFPMHPLGELSQCPPTPCPPTLQLSCPPQYFFFLSLIFVSLIYICLCIVLFHFILYRTLFPSWTWVSLSSLMSGKLMSIISSNISQALLIFSFYKMQMLMHLMLSQTPLRLSLFLFILCSVLWQWFPTFCLPAHLFVLLPQLFCYWFLLVYFSFQLQYHSTLLTCSLHVLAFC